jgi:hypothetical protein
MNNAANRVRAKTIVESYRAWRDSEDPERKAQADKLLEDLIDAELTGAERRATERARRRHAR